MQGKQEPAIDRFNEKYIVVDSGCWIWTATTMPNGYGKFRINGKTVLAHRFSYEHFVGPIPEGLQLDHKCRNRNCVHYRHLEPVTHLENVRRGESFNRNKTSCIRGHEFTEENTVLQKTGRVCRACNEQRAKERWVNNKETLRYQNMQYRINNRERLIEKDRQRYLKKKELKKENDNGKKD